MVQYGFYFDQSRCIGCNACTVACKQWNQLPPGPLKWMRVYQWEKGSFPDVKVHFLAVPCYHCEKPVCATACPTGAVFKEEEYGVVLVDQARCQGKKKCWKACPYGAIVFAGDGGEEKASKCTMCIDRLKEGKKPICVLSCSMRALEFGPLQDLVSRFGELRELEDMPSGKLTRPAVIFKPAQPKREIVPWNPNKALALWKSRGPYASQNTPRLFDQIEDVTRVPPDMIGRNRLVLKAETTKDLMYYTTDDD